jgi:hypothetical protein
MQPVKDLNDTLSKIHSMFFNLVQENRLSRDELEDYNRAAARAFESLDQIKHLLKKDRQIIEGAFKREQNNEVKAKKYRLLLQIIGLQPGGIEKLERLPIKFLKSIFKSLEEYNCSVTSEIHFELIMQKYRWVLLQIERDLSNIHSIKLQKKMHRIGNQKVKILARKILIQIAEESNHIADDIRAGNTEKQLKEKIEEYWYEKLSTHNPFE